MDWISVEDRLPCNHEQVLTLNEGYFPESGDILCQRKSYRIFQGSFNRSTSWSTPYCPGTWAVKYWMPLPKLPLE